MTQHGEPRPAGRCEFGGTVGVLLTQRAMTGPLDGFDDFWAAVAAAA